jgi:hypothetical protein
MYNSLARLSSPKTEMASGIFVNGSGRILVSLFFWIGKRVTILLPIAFLRKMRYDVTDLNEVKNIEPQNVLQL